MDLFLTLLGHLGPFQLSAADATNASTLDSLGRFWLQGPTDFTGDELVGILSMALPIALLRFLKATSTRQRILYAVPIGLLPYAMFATERKTSLLAPAIAFLTIAYFRRRQLRPLAPLLLVLAIGGIAVSPNTLGHVVSQFTSANSTKTATTDARTGRRCPPGPLDPFAVRPRSGVVRAAHRPDRRLGHSLPLVETGVLGLLTFFLIPISVISVARKSVSRRYDVCDACVGRRVGGRGPPDLGLPLQLHVVAARP